MCSYACTRERARGSKWNENAKEKPHAGKRSKYLQTNRKRQKHNRQQLTEPVCKFCRSPASVQTPCTGVHTISVTMWGPSEKCWQTNPGPLTLIVKTHSKARQYKCEKEEQCESIVSHTSASFTPRERQKEAHVSWASSQKQRWLDKRINYILW